MRALMVRDNSFHLARLRGGIKPFRLYWYPRLRSTNDHAAALRKAGKIFAPAVVLTGHQLAGRGRGTNTWWSGNGSLTATFVLAINEQVAPHQLPLLAGLAARNAAAEITGHQDIQLKWPNDLLYQGRKLCGLLCERILKADLIGIGMNVNLELGQVAPHLRQRVTSLNLISGGRFELTETLIILARHLHQTVTRAAERQFADVLREYDTHHALRGRTISVATGNGSPLISGRCEGLDQMGRLLIRSRSTLHHVISGQVQ
jgi:BirA family transcriptional regulator, biotin operon repressor / biotin---[acetyl-CoA-carboxylase] ligase